MSKQQDQSTAVQFTREMKSDYTILIPTMLPLHFLLLTGIFESYGYRCELLCNESKRVVDCGLQYVHNDTCYPALLVIGQFIDALQSGKYDTDRVALMLTQTGGGCRASNYIPLLQKALNKAGYGHVPVISFNVAGLASSPGFRVTIPMLHRLLYAVTYGDLLMLLRNQCRPYEAVPGSAQALAESWAARLAAEMAKGRVRYKQVKRNYAAIIRDFAALELKKERGSCARVGIVGEIFVKFSPLGNNDLEDFLISQGAEPCLPGLLDFCLYTVSNGIADSQLYGIRPLKALGCRVADRFLAKKQMDVIRAVQEEGTFRPATPFAKTRSLIDGIIGIGAKMGEGWLLPAEMMELIEDGVQNIVCAQPFGCLPNHIMGKGVAKPIKEKYPNVNIVAIDYDPGASRINQENRIKLMLATATRRSETAGNTEGAAQTIETERQKDAAPVL